MVYSAVPEPMRPLPTHDHVTLNERFERVPRPKWARIFGRIDGAIDDVNDLNVVPVNIGFVKRIYRAASEGWRYSVAAWRWLRPARPALKLESLPGLQSLVGMDHVGVDTFATCLIEQCNETARDHPGLALWIANRVALLEYIARPPAAPDEDLKVAPMALGRLMMQAQYKRTADPEGAVALAQEVLSRAMHGAAHAVRSAFGAEDVDLNANLMFRCPHRPPIAAGDTRAQANARCGESLWGPQPADTPCLVIVAESTNSRHLGFWIPMIKDEAGACLPGAPLAFTNRVGAAVFKDDLPPLKSFGGGLELRWLSYMATEFRDMLFVSVPFRIPRGGKGRDTVAVLNVNVTPNDIAPWRRAYHAEWLKLARDRAEPFLDVAANALLLLTGKDPMAIIDSASPLWDKLPQEAPRRLIGGES
jgi:hypothetical protein